MDPQHFDAELDLNDHFDTNSFEADPFLNQPKFYCGSEYGDCGNLNDFFKLNFEKLTYCETVLRFRMMLMRILILFITLMRIRISFDADLP